MGKCFVCGNPETENHHVVPQISGGTKTVPLCSKCYMKVHGLEGLITSFIAGSVKLERDSISQRTQSALDAQKDLIKKQGYFISKKTGRRVEKHGNPNMTEEARWKGCMASAKSRRDAAKKDKSFIQAYKYAKVLREKNFKNETIASELNSMGLRTPRGCEYIPASIPQLIRKGDRLL